MSEIVEWRPIKGYEGIYEVSSTGEVKSFAKMIRYGKKDSQEEKGLILKPRYYKGYQYVTLYKFGKPKKFSVHFLVASAFLEKPLDKSIVNHKKVTRSNNNLENLEWSNPKENANHAVKMGLINKFFIPYSDLVKLYIDEKKSIGEIGRMYNVSRQTISNRLNEYGIKKRTLSEQATIYVIPPEKLIEGLKNNMTLKELAWKFGCNKALIRLKIKNLKKQGYL